MAIDDLRDKKILILGLAREGRDTLNFLRRKFPEKVFAIGDRLNFDSLEKETQKIIESAKNLKLYLGPDYLTVAKNYNLIVKSPGIPPAVLNPFLTEKQIITSQTEIFFENCPGKIIGVTGTKGKSTTASLIYQILKKAGLKVHLIGNIGTPVLAFLAKAKENDIFIYELSSQQLSTLHQSPHIAVLLNIFPEHLDYHQSFPEYVKAKSNICRFQKKTDYLIYSAKNPTTKKIAKLSAANKIPINIPAVKKIISRKEIPFEADFYLLNVAAAIAVAKIFKIPAKIVKEGIKTFKPLPHRLEFVGNYRGIDFYNDSLATSSMPTIAAIDALGEKLTTLIAGGFDRGLSYKELAQEILKSKIKTLILFPTTGKRIWEEITNNANRRKQKLPQSFFAKSMEEAVKLAYQFSKKGEICLLSCASASFGLFKDYKERGDLFKKNVKKLGSARKKTK